jgi:hypothetical protein
MILLVLLRRHCHAGEQLDGTCEFLNPMQITGCANAPRQANRTGGNQ